jgi:hypothetical protein
MTSLEYSYYVDINDENRHIIENEEELIELMRTTFGNTTVPPDIINDI